MKQCGLLIGLAILWLMAAPLAVSGPMDDSVPVVELVYVETNIDASAGGHLALRIGAQVYHYQALDSRLLLVREPWSQFQHFYQQLENRGLRVATLDLNGRQQLAVESHMNRQLIVQQGHMRTERLLWLEHHWYAREFGGAGELKLPGLGYFLPIPQAVALPSGAAAGLSTQLSQIQHAIALLEPASVSLAHNVSRGRVSAASSGSLEQRESLLQLHAAISIIESGTGLRPQNLVSLERYRLTGSERQLLVQYQLELEADIQRLLLSTGADRGYPLLISRARLLAVRQSLARNHWVFLNSFPHYQQGDSGALTAQQAEVFRQLRRQLEQTWQFTRRAASDSASLDTQAYARLETAASRLYESARGGLNYSTQDAWRPALLMPQRDGALLIESLLPATDTQAAASLASQYSAALSRAYEYRLLSQNCVTQLIQALNHGAADAGEVDAVLGARLDAGDGLAFIPRVLFNEALPKLRLSGVRYQLSRREQAIAGMRTEQPAWQVDLRESNVWTSQAYSGSIRDDAFLFFTDGRAWLRPLQGIANVSYAAFSSSLGILSAPYDGGARLSDGLRGMFYSAPELLFLNLRKGQYDTLASP